MQYPGSKTQIVIDETLCNKGLPAQAAEDCCPRSRISAAVLGTRPRIGTSWTSIRPLRRLDNKHQRFCLIIPHLLDQITNFEKSFPSGGHLAGFELKLFLIIKSKSAMIVHQLLDPVWPAYLYISSQYSADLDSSLWILQDDNMGLVFSG